MLSPQPWTLDVTAWALRTCQPVLAQARVRAPCGLAAASVDAPALQHWQQLLLLLAPLWGLASLAGQQHLDRQARLLLTLVAHVACWQQARRTHPSVSVPSRSALAG